MNTAARQDYRSPVFLGSGLGPSDRPGMTFLGKSNFFT